MTLIGSVDVNSKSTLLSTLAGKRRRNTPHHTGANEDQRIAHHDPPNGTAFRAERHANADLGCAPRDRVRQQPVEADRGKGNGHAPEHHREPGKQDFTSQRLPDLLPVWRASSPLGAPPPSNRL